MCSELNTSSPPAAIIASDFKGFLTSLRVVVLSGAFLFCVFFFFLPQMTFGTQTPADV